jgi:hypothetical protein
VPFGFLCGSWQAVKAVRQYNKTLLSWRYVWDNPLQADVVVVSGGNTLFACDRWNKIGLTSLLRQAKDRGVVMVSTIFGTSTNVFYLFLILQTHRRELLERSSHLQSYSPT